MVASPSSDPTAFTTTTASPIQRPKSPPLAFERTPNDSLIPPTETYQRGSSRAASTLSSPPVPSNMGRSSPRSQASNNVGGSLQVIVDQQHETISQLHDAFAKERHTWGLERQHLLERISQLEHLLRNDWSPARSPVMTPSSGHDMLSPQSRALAANPSLPTIAEDENILPLSSRRDAAPTSLHLPTVTEASGEEPRRQSAVSFTNAEGLQVIEIPISSPSREQGISPPPPMYRMMAGHTPIKVPRPPTPPPGNMSVDGIDDTPTRNNTHINTLLVRSNDEDEDPELTGPLNMPELPHQPEETNFTLEALSKKLEHIADHPEASKPMVFAHRSPGLASPASPAAEQDDLDISPHSKAGLANEEKPNAPMPTHQPQSQVSSNALSPSATHVSRDGGAMSPQEVHEAKVQAEFEQGGIRLKKKTSINFGAPFGSLAGFGPRRTSHDQA